MYGGHTHRLSNDWGCRLKHDSGITTFEVCAMVCAAVVLVILIATSFGR